MNFGPAFDDVLASIAFQNHMANLARHVREDRATITELDDASSEESAQSSVSQPPATSFERFMLLEDQSSKYMKEGKYFEAYGLLKAQYKEGAKVHFSSVLTKYYVTLMQTDRVKKAEKIRDELSDLFRDKFGDSSEEICKYADTLHKRKDYLLAILFYQVSFSFAEKETQSMIASLSQKIAGGCAQSALTLLVEKCISKKIVRDCIIPFLKEVRGLVARTLAEMKLSSLIQAVCLHHVERCQFQIGDLQAQESTLKEGIDLIKQHYGRDGNQFKIFGVLMSHLGINYFLANRQNESVKMFNQAIAALKKAKDFDSPREKEEHLLHLQKKLEIAQGKF